MKKRVSLEHVKFSIIFQHFFTILMRFSKLNSYLCTFVLLAKQEQ